VGRSNGSAIRTPLRVAFLPTTTSTHMSYSGTRVVASQALGNRVATAWALPRVSLPTLSTTG
jgi:hypothetical protein